MNAENKEIFALCFSIVVTLACFVSTAKSLKSMGKGGADGQNVFQATVSAAGLVAYLWMTCTLFNNVRDMKHIHNGNHLNSVVKEYKLQNLDKRTEFGEDVIVFKPACLTPDIHNKNWMNVVLKNYVQR